jgi:nitrogen fixation/metabolism regulation signal transduction histidine kinase
MSRVDTVLPDKKAIIVIISLLNQQYLFIQCSYDPPSSYTYNDGSFIIYSPSEQFSNLLLPSIIPQLSQEVIQEALVSRSWVNYSYNNTLYNISCKSKYSKKSPPNIEFIAAGIPSLTQTEIFLYGLKASPLVLILVFIVLFLVIFQRSNYSLRKLSLRFRDRIFIIIFFIALLPIIIISNFSKTIIADQITKAEREQLIIRSANIQQILRDVLSDSSQRIYLQEILQRLGRSIDAQIDLYSGSGCIVASNNISDYINIKQSLIMPPEVYLTLNWHKSLFTLVEREGLSSLLSSAFRSIQLDQSKKYAFVGITSKTNLAQIEEKNSTTMSIIYGTLSLLSLLLLIIGSYISYRVASPLQEIITATDLVAKGDLAVRLNIQRNDEIGDLAGAFNRMTNELEKSRDRVAQSEREVAWKEMARQVAHEIKNPLTPMKLSVQHVQHSFQENDTNFPSVFQRVMRTLSEQIDVLTRIATEFSRFGEMPRRRYAFISLKNVIESAVRLFDSERPRIRFVIDIPERISSVYADEEEFRRALVNLLRNAIQAIEGWGIIVISAVETRGLIHLKITDTGIGMSEETLRKVFDPNFSTKTSGMGLGLAIVKKTITDMSGTITVESEIGKGTTFTIDLPARES